MTLDYPVYDADNHLYETPEAMTGGLPRKWRKDFRYVEVDGRTKLAVGGRISEYIPNPTFEVLGAPGAHEKWYRGKNTEGLSMRELTGEPIRCIDAYRNGKARLELMDQQGLHATLVFPTLASAVEGNLSYDHELVGAIFHSLNQWMHDEWGFHREERLFAVPFVSLMDVDAAVKELEWLLERGARAVGIRPAPVAGYRHSRSFGLPDFDPFWARVAEAGIFVTLHSGDGGPYSELVHAWEGGTEFRPFQQSAFRLCTHAGGRAIADSMSALICHGVFARHPTLRVASIENGSTWVEPLLQTFEHVYGQVPKDFAEPPVETFRRHVYVSPYYEEPIARLAERIGVDHVLFGSDYPHPEGLANPLDFLHELVGMSAADTRRIMSENLKALLEGRPTA